MKNTLKMAISSLFLMAGWVQAEPSSVGPINFSGGLNIASLQTLIPDQDSPDLCNCDPSILGSLSKRNGSKRFIPIPISSMPITSLKMVYSSTFSGQNYKALFAASSDKIVISTKTLNPSWVVVSSNNVVGQRYSIVTMNGQALIAGDGLKENVRKYDIAASSQYVLRNAFEADGSTIAISINPRGKHQIVANNYYILANVQISTEMQHLPTLTTYYASRILFSKLNNFSSMTAVRFIDFNSNDGEEITGLGTLYGGSNLTGGDFKTIVNVFKPSAIGELSFTVLDLPSQGGDWVFSEVKRGVGVIAPRTLQTTPLGYVFLDKSGMGIWDGTSFKIISAKIKPLIDDLIKSGRYKSATGIYYPKKEWYVLSVEHPQRLPKGKNNYVLVYDLRIGEWFPFCNWLADSMETSDNQSDTGQLFYGDSADGYVHEVDLETRPDDSPKELLLDVMDSTFSWVGSSQTISEVYEGSASIRVSIPGIIKDGLGGPTNNTYISSITRMGIFHVGEWHDKSRITLNDRLSFNAFAHNLSSITSLRVDLEVKNTSSFDSNFSSFTISSNSFAVNRAWVKFDIPLSAFPTKAEWTDLSIESVPFYNRFTFYGMRFVLNGVNISSVSIDNVRITQGADNPIKTHRFTKLFDFQSPAYKSFGTILLTMDKSPDASFSMDIYNDFGQKTRTEKFSATIPKEILVFRKGNTPGFSILDSKDYSVLRQTQTVSVQWDCLNGIMDEKNIVCADRTNDRLLMFSRTDFSTFTALYGTFGYGTSNFNLIHELSQYPGGYFVSDLYNHRVKVHSTKNLSFIKMYGSLGNETTSFHLPTAVAADGSFFYVLDESNDRLLKMDQSTFSILSQVALDHNVAAESSLSASDKNLFLAYNNLDTEQSDAVSCVLEKRDKANLELLHRADIKPQGVSTGSYRTQGSIGLLGRYVYICFSNDSGQNNIVYYIQKRLQSNLELVSEYSWDSRLFSSAGYSLSFNPLTKTTSKDLKVEGRYVQIKFYDEDLDNYWRLYNMSPLLNVQPLGY